MKHFQSVLFGATFAATTAAAVAFAPSSAQAIQLTGSITIDGAATITGTASSSTVGVNFGTITDIETEPLGSSFASFVPSLANAPITIQNLTLTKQLSGAFTSGFVGSFLNFGSRTLNGDTGTLTFDLNASTFQVNTTNSTTVVSFDGITGTWKFNGETLATGIIYATTAGVDRFSISIDAQPVPEPLTMGGLALGAGFGAFLKTRYSKKNEQLENA